AAPQRRTLPAVKHKDWPRNQIDRFVLARLEQEGLTPTPEAPLPTLLRRASLDLTGLPPAPSQITAWLRQPDPLAAAVHELLASEWPRIGWTSLVTPIRTVSTTMCSGRCGVGGTG